MNILEYAETVVATADIELIEALFQLSLVLKAGAAIRERIEAEVNHLNPYETKVNSFQELVRLHEHETSPLQELVSSNGWLVLQDDSQLPWTFDEFLQLFRKTQFRGLRILPSLFEGEVNFAADTNQAKLENRRFALIADSHDSFHIVFYEKEFFIEDRSDDSASTRVFSKSKDIVRLTYNNYKEELQKKQVMGHAAWSWKEVFFPAMDIIERFFGGDSIPSYSIYFLDDFRWDLLLDAYYQYEKDLLVFYPLQDNGELELDAHFDRDGRLDEIKFDYYIVRNEDGHVTLNESGLMEFIQPYSSGYVSGQNISGYYPEDFPNLTREEQYSFYSYAMKDDGNLVILGEIFFDDMEGVKYGCFNLDSGVIWLIADKQLKSTREFRVLDSYQRQELFFHSIELIE